MSLKEKIKIIPRKKIVDSRGWFLKVIDGKEEKLPQHTGEVYIIQANPGETRANHYHKEANEWFTLIQGKADMLIEDVDSGEKLTIKIDGNHPETVFVPNNIAHAFKNTADQPYVLITYTDKLYDPEDTIQYKLNR
jgi:dTDP-4-dehydrorhamnose 3,5-epimerase-like enzyme